ncbi:hypothetical protein GNY06_01710 [Elizabethkingia argentiflava]|uniref:DUF4157 domain-containing protein n=1 Tax=Elizabethkingia argenteiflava TaxID=2681556 RepID=A0A845PR80_9FLAO|nr:hypothetical protein [Elizabethkingia argenteiflava]NAW50155.1 hypothetical protein [Elizabethkingia argenteiflava]
MILVCRSLFKNTKITAMALYPFIILNKKELRRDEVLLNHEKIHLRQQLELLIIFFYLLYGLEYILKRIKLGDPYQAYRSISFEREAHDKEEDIDYLRHRKFWNFIKYW